MAIYTKNMVNYTLEEINDDNWRPGMELSGWVVKYGLDDRFGWTRRRCFITKEDAELFITKLNFEEAGFGDLAKRLRDLSSAYFEYGYKLGKLDENASDKEATDKMKELYEYILCNFKPNENIN